MDQHQSYPSLLPSPRQPFSLPGEKKDASMADLAKHAVRVETLTRTLPETEMAPARKPSQKETIVLQPSISRC